MRTLNEIKEVFKMNLSFAGCGFLGIYHVGVAVCFKKYAPHLLLSKISGASAGALAATCLLCDMPLGEMTSDFFRVVNEARSHSLGPFSPSFNIQTCLLEGLQKFLPEDAHLRVSGKLHISLTRVYDGKNVIVTQFNSRDDLLQALLCACFIPGFSGILPPRFHGVRYMDGAFSDNLPTLDENTVTVSPFSGESDICPRDNSAQMFHLNWANTSIELSKQNMNRFVRILFPPKPEILSNMCQQGFDDALHFLHRNNLISCTRCLAIQSTFVMSKQAPEYYDPECKSCVTHRTEAMIGNNMPETVISVFNSYIENANKGLLGWLIKRPAKFILRALSMPATLPCDIVYATLTKILSSAPSVKSSMFGLAQFVLDNLQSVLLPRRDGFREMEAETCKSIYDDDPILKPFNYSDRRSSIVDLMMHDDDRAPSFEVRGNLVSRRNSTVPSNGHSHGGNIGSSIGSGGGSYCPSIMTHSSDVDAFEHVLNITSQHDTVYAYYYLDETDKTMKFTKIFDVTESDNPIVQTQLERDNNQKLEYDECDLRNMEYGTTDIDCNSNNYNQSNILQHELELIYPETKDMVDWTCSEIKIEEINSDPMDNDEDDNNNNNNNIEVDEDDDDISSTESSSSIDTYFKPEADQTATTINDTTMLSQHVLNALNRDISNYSIITDFGDNN